MAPFLRHSLYLLSLLVLSVHPLPAQDDRVEAFRPQIRLADQLPPLSHWFHHLPSSLADFRGIVLTEAPTITYHPVLPYVFFDSASTQIPDRYVLFDAPVSDSPLPEPMCTDDLACHYQVLNIIGGRLQRYPDFAITIVGYNAESYGGEDSSHSRGRAESVQAYLQEVWGIGLDRMVIRIKPGSPIDLDMRAPFPSWHAEARRVEIVERIGAVEGAGWKEREFRHDSLNQLLFGPVVDSAMGRVTFPAFMSLDIDNGIDPDAVTSQHLEVRFNDSLVDRIVDMFPRMDSVPYFLMRAIPGVLMVGEGSLSIALVVRNSDGQVQQSRELEIPVMVISASESRDRFATERRIVRGRVISGIWGEDPNPFGSVARGTIQLFRKAKAGTLYRLSTLSSVDSLGRSDRRYRMTHMASLAYGAALKPAEGEIQLESQTAGLASSGLLGFALPEERVIGESTYIVLDFPRCVDSVDPGECRFGPEYIHRE